METQYLIACFLVIVYVRVGTFAEEQEQERMITDCDREIGGIMCTDEFKPKIRDCADLMPEDEHPYFFDCGREESLTDTQDWMELLDAVCNEKDPVEKALVIIDCWDRKMNETIEEFQNDDVYPIEHFKCKKAIWEEVVGEASCPCQMEKTNSCNSANNPSNPLG